jgi:hypothetical protein
MPTTNTKDRWIESLLEMEWNVEQLLAHLRELGSDDELPLSGRISTLPDTPLPTLLITPGSCDRCGNQLAAWWAEIVRLLGSAGAPTWPEPAFPDSRRAGVRPP